MFYKVVHIANQDIGTKTDKKSCSELDEMVSVLFENRGIWISSLQSLNCSRSSFVRT